MRATNLLEAAALRQAVRPVCKCGHATSFDPFGLWWHYERRGWDDQLRAVRKRFWCIKCRSLHKRKLEPARLDLVGRTGADFVLPLPPEDVWKRVSRSLR
jgi:hypothetical protein